MNVPKGLRLDRGWIRAWRAARRHAKMKLAGLEPAQVREEIARGPVRKKP